MSEVIFLRHGESVWNKENRFTGWIDVDLSQRGLDEALQAARTLRAEGRTFDVAHTSVLKRAIRTLWIVLDELDLMWIPVHRSWRLNERHYGALQGLDKAETAARHGEEQVLRWRRGYAVQPPPLTTDDPTWPGRDPRYADLAPDEVPVTESLADTMRRVLPYWEVITRDIGAGRRVLVSAHGNSIRALVKHLDRLGDEEIMGLNIPTGIPLVYELDESFAPVRHYYLGDPEEVARAQAAVANQGRAKR